MTGIPASSDFDVAAREVLEFLHQRLGFDLWMLTRKEGDDWLVLQSHDQGQYDIQSGAVFQWADSFCARMVEGEGPCVAPQSDQVPAYVEAPIGQQVSVGAYAGVPLNYRDGSLFGTLCAIHPTAQPQELENELPLIQLLAGLLSKLLDAGLQATEQARHVEQVKAEALRDGLTQLYNRRGWDQLLAEEEQRCQQYGHPTCVIVIDLDGLKQVNDRQGHAQGDQLILRASQTLQTLFRQRDIVARVGGDEFSVLCIQCNIENGNLLLERAQAAFADAQVDASFGLAPRHHSQGLRAAWEEADAAMYKHKRSKKALRANCNEGSLTTDQHHSTPVTDL